MKIYLKKRQEEINHLLKVPRNKFTVGAFHKFRVEIKKVIALSDLINSCSKDFKLKKTLEPFRLIFHQAGKVREFQLEEAMLKKHLKNNSIKEYRIKLKKHRLKERELFFIMLNNKLPGRINKKFNVIEQFISRLDEKKVNNYMVKIKTRIKNILHQKYLPNHKIHKIRKQLKMLYFCTNSLSTGGRDRNRSTRSGLPEILGKWHDCQIIIRHLEKVIKASKINTNEIPKLEKIKTKIISERDHLFRKIKIAIPKSEFYK